MIAGAGASEILLPVITPTSPTNPASDIAKNLTGRDYISWSAVSTFRTCPLKYKFRYVDSLPEESVSSALVFGTGVHTAVEQHFQALLAGEEQPDVERLMFAYRSAWLPHDPAAVSFGTKETRETLDDLASLMLTAFLNGPAASVQGRVLGVEEEIRGMLVEGVPDLYGRVDLLTEDTDTLVATDIKTNRGKWSAEQVEDSGEQLLLYSSHLASEISPGKKIATRFLVLTKTKTGHRGARSRGQPSRRETHSCWRGAGLAGDREWRLLSGAFCRRVLRLRLSGGVSGVDGVMCCGKRRPGLKNTLAAFYWMSAVWKGKSTIPWASLANRSPQRPPPVVIALSLPEDRHRAATHDSY